MNCKKYEQFDESDIDIIDLLNNHPPLEGDKYLTDKIMTSVLYKSESKIEEKNISNTFQLKLANSFICTGVFLLVTNLFCLKSNTPELQQTISQFNKIVSNIFRLFN